MSQTGVKSVGWRRAARSRGQSTAGTRTAYPPPPLESRMAGVYHRGAATPTEEEFHAVRLRQAGLSRDPEGRGCQRHVRQPRHDRRACKTALAHPTGPVFLSLPVDVLNAERDLDFLAPTRIDPRIRGPRAAVRDAARRLARARRPLIVAGDCVAHGDALAELAEVAELLGAPVMTEPVASTCNFPFTHPLYAGAMPRLAPQIRAALGRHDLLFSVGGDLFTLSLPSDVDPMPPGLDVVHLDVDSWELGKNYPASVAILGDPKATLPDVAEALR